jgi:hypothetical protein
LETSRGNYEGVILSLGVRGHQRPSEVIRGCHRLLEAVRGHYFNTLNIPESIAGVGPALVPTCASYGHLGRIHNIYDKECVFLHENSKLCKYGSMSDRNCCMFKHEINVDDKVEIIHDEEADDANLNGMTENEYENEIIEDILSDDEISDVGEQDESVNKNFDTADMTFTNPSQETKSSSDGLFKCDKCEFASSRKDIIENHKELLHNWCSLCYSNFENKKNLKNHKKNEHSDNEA